MSLLLLVLGSRVKDVDVPETRDCSVTLFNRTCSPFVMAYRRQEDRRQYDSNSSDCDTEYSEPDERRKPCIKPSMKNRTGFVSNDRI